MTMISSANIIVFFSILTFALFGGWLSRMCGGAPPKLPWGLDQWIYAIPYMIISIPGAAIIVSMLSILSKDAKRTFAVYTLLLFPYFSAFAGKRTGHGGGIDLGHSKKIRNDESLEFLIKGLHGKISEYWYDVLLLSITGLAVTLSAGIIVCFMSPFMGALILLSGLLKGPAYMIGWIIYPDGEGEGIPYLNEATAIGEFLTGVFGYSILGLAAFIMWGQQ